ncbi:hypothetical protein Q4S45_12600 [Massilia sp. R2A-15]|uniref:hypothetical protein n=1 Tax=Massilia sp. R2A-15 TaxID=3064278 RepID=UPI002732F660|nr:hypothetical protein [Massilia sp. R2A-15]WLI87582.1 hypothetical protein Q4S45_12600 [Massilia sp. R2A-15]
MKLFFLLLSLAIPAAADPIGEIEGVYKERTSFEVFSEGPAHVRTGENIVEIVRQDQSHIYFRAEYLYRNGHNCSISGIAAAEKGGFVYRERESLLPNEPPCTFTIRREGDALTLTDRLATDDARSCNAYCGANGTLSALSMPMKARRPIRYMDRLKKSRQYQAALEAAAH